MYILPFSRQIINKSLNIIFAVIFLFLSSNLRIYYSSVPITLQSFALLIIGLSLKEDTFYVFSLFLLIFCSERLFTPSGGYILGMLISSYIIGYSYKNYREFSSLSSFSSNNMYLVHFIALLIPLILGTLFLNLFFIKSTLESIRLGFIPFVPVELIKVLIFHLIVRRI